MANLKYKNANGEWKILNTVRGPKGDNADITINGETIENASIYTAIESGNPGQFLMSSGNNKTPEWTSLSEVAISGNYDDLNNALESTSDLISNSEKVLTSGGAYTAFAQRGVPSGGGEGQVLIKKSDSNYEVEWGEAADPNAIGGDGSIKKIVELTYEEYQALDIIDQDTEYHIIDAQSSVDNLSNFIESIILETDKRKHPIGSLEFNVSGINPSVYLGFGTWEAWGTGRVPVGIDIAQDEFNTVENTGGEKTHTLTQAEMPHHYHHDIELSGRHLTGWNQKTGSTTIFSLESLSSTNGVENQNYFTTGYAGGNQAHNNLQPYITCYMWKRVL